MTTKLTLTIEDEVIKKAKIYARTTGRSLSDLVETYLEQVTQDHGIEQGISSKLKNLIGSVPLPKDFDEKKELEKYYRTKYL